MSTAALQKAVTAARAAVRATRLRAPMSGTIAQLTTKVGEAGTSGSTFTTIVNPRLFTVTVSVGEDDITDIRKGQRASVTVAAVSGLRLAGHITRVALVPDSSGSAVTYPVTITLDEPTTRVRAGMATSVRIVTAQASGLVIPAQALTGSIAKVVTATGSTPTRVQTGLEGDDGTIVTGGLSAGQSVLETSASALAGTTATTPATTRTSATSFGGFGGGAPGIGGPPPGGR